jgi:hypothetical protein
LQKAAEAVPEIAALISTWLKFPIRVLVMGLFAARLILTEENFF